MQIMYHTIRQDSEIIFAAAVLCASVTFIGTTSQLHFL